MKKKTSGNISFIKFDEDDDLDLFYKTIDLTLYTDKKTIYCVDFMHKRALMWDKTLNKWTVINFDLLSTELIPLNDEQSNKIYKTNPPFELIEEMKKHDAENRLNYWDKLRKTTNRKVIGWIFPSDKIKIVNCDENRYAALVNDIVDHHYLFGGDMMDMVPVFDDCVACDLSERSWGDVIALSLGEADEMAYARYSWTNPENRNSNKFKMPKFGLYKNVIKSMPVKVNNDTYNYVLNNVYNFFQNFKNESSKINSIYFLVNYQITIDSTLYTIGQVDSIELINAETDESIIVSCLGFREVYSKEDFKELYDEVTFYDDTLSVINRTEVDKKKDDIVGCKVIVLSAI